MSRRGLTLLLGLLVAVLVASGCASKEDDTGGGDDTPATGNGGAIVITIKGGEVSPNAKRIEAKVNQTVKLEIHADEAGEMHVHSSPDQTIEYDEGTTNAEITIDKPGVVDVETHDPAQTVLQIEVR